MADRKAQKPDHAASRLSSPSSPSSQDAWEELAQTFASSRQVSADKLIEWPAQLALCGDVTGKRVLDVGCGTGDKARSLAERGAARVTALDASTGFASNWQGHADCANLSFVLADFEAIPALPELAAAKFDLIVSFQALMYARDLPGTVRSLAALLAPGGALVFSVPHPFRFAVLKNEREAWGHGFAYQHTAPYRYPSPWKEEVMLEHGMPRVSDYLNAVAAAGLRLTAAEEPAPTEELRRLAPEKAYWMDRYIGILLLRAVCDA